jgi:hypothetical protein
VQDNSGGHGARRILRPFFFLSLNKKGEEILKRGDSLKTCKELIQGILKEKTEVEGE